MENYSCQKNSFTDFKINTMPKIFNIINNTKFKKLEALEKRSKEIMEHYKKDNVFHSKTMNELLTDKFEYKGTNECETFVKDLKTGKPVKLDIVTGDAPDEMPGWTLETFELQDKNGGLAGYKNFRIKKREDGSFLMNFGDMETMNKSLAGVGFRLDQLQIERALSLGINVIPRHSEADATLYHTKMGFLPKSSKLVEVDSVSKIRQLISQYLGDFAEDFNIKGIEPIIENKQGRFFIDLNKTIANLNLEICKDDIGRQGQRRTKFFESKTSMLELKGEELDRWKEIIKKHPILSKLPFDLHQY